MSNRSFLRGLFFVGVCLAGAACQRSQSPAVARVGHAEITVADLKSRLRETPVAYQQYVATPEGRRQFLSLLIREKVLQVEAQRAGIKNDSDYRKTVAQFKNQWEQRLKDFEESLLVETYLRRLRTKELSVTDSETQRFYNNHTDDFAHPVEIEASHILVRTPAEAEAALVRLKKGEAFEKVAKEVSMDPATASRGGKLAPFHRGQLVPEFEDAAAKLSKGQVSGIVKSQFGYHLIKKIGQKNLPARTYDEAKEDIRTRLEREKFDAWVTRTQSALGVTIDEKTMAGLTVSPAPNDMPTAQEVRP